LVEDNYQPAICDHAVPAFGW